MCNAPSISSAAYDFSGCDTSKGPISPDECSVTCKPGHEKAPYYPIEVSCTSFEGDFAPSGCYPQGNGATAYAL